MRDVIKKLAEQFAYTPVVEHAASLKRFSRVIVCGMGGSHLAADFVKASLPHISFTVHRSYGLPQMSEEELKQSLVVVSSYSGNTEEAIDSFETAREKGLALAAITTGGMLLELAKKHAVPYVVLPKTGIQPRAAIGFSIKGLLVLVGAEKELEEISSLAKTFSPEAFEAEGKALAETLKGFVPVIYASQNNEALAYNWKIKFNEGAKIPSFSNVFPELNHNEMTGFDTIPSTRTLSDKCFIIILHHPQDDSRITKRMELCAALYAKRGVRVKTLELKGVSRYEMLFSSLVLADWTAYYLARYYGTEPEQVPMVEEFKRLMR